MSKRILVVEDEEHIAIGLRDDLELEGYEIDLCDNGEKALTMTLTEQYDLLVLDVGLPGKDGFEVCRELRSRKPELPILMLTAKSLEAEKVLGLELGADDYVTKPFSPLELRARVKALLRRTSTVESSLLEFGEFSMDLQRMELSNAGKVIPLTTLEFKLLTAMVREQGRVLNREQLLDLVWGSGTVLTNRVIDTHVANLRKKLEPHGSKHISSIRGVGYRFDL